MHKFHVRLTGDNSLVSIDVTFKVFAASYGDAETQAWGLALACIPPKPGTPKLDVTAIHIGQCEAGCL